MNCNRKGCDQEAKWYPEVKLWAKGYSKKSHPPAVATITIGVCDTHMDEMKVEHVLTGDEFGRIEKMFSQAGMAKPSLKTAELGRVRIKQKEGDK